jgi:hypothetical protein
MKTMLVITLTTFAMATFASSVPAACCKNPECPMMMHTVNADQNPALMEPVKSVFDNYLTIQSALAKDSIDGVAANAFAIATAARGDSMKMLSPEVAADADALAETKDLASARVVFKRLSKSLIQYLSDHNVTGAFVEVYCPTAKASWLQKGDKIDNPYTDASMRSCGQIQNKTKQKSS